MLPNGLIEPSKSVGRPEIALLLELAAAAALAACEGAGIEAAASTKGRSNRG